MGKIYTDYISDFLTKWETRQLVGYVPCDPKNYKSGSTDGYTPIGSSGVTIGTGVDLGQQDLSDLIRYGVTGALQDKLKPYLGKIKYRAIETLHQTPLRLTEAECDTLDRGVHSAYIRTSEEKFNDASVPKFDSIPCQAQAVVVSLFYQLGSEHNRYYPVGVWNALTACQWDAAATLLAADTSRYKARRKDEAKLLREIPGVKA